MGNIEKWKTLMDAFSGRKTLDVAAVYPVVPVDEMVHTLSEIKEETWGLYAFTREPLEGKFSLQQKFHYTKCANECGRTWARKIVEQFGTRDPKVIAAKMGMKVKETVKPIGGGVVLFAQFVRPNEITIFTDCIDKTLFEKRRDVVPMFQREVLIDVILAHELFHAVEEENQDIIYTHTEKVELWKKPFSNRSQIACLSEIAAMSFAAELNGLKVSPYMLDVLLVYSYDKNTAYGLFDEICKLQKNVPVHSWTEFGKWQPKQK